MESQEYQTLFELEPLYWWFRGLHLILLDTLHTLGLESHEAVLDAGCGTGQNLVNIGRQVTSSAYGFDVSPEAAFFCKKRGLTNICRASINDMPFASDTFAAVVSVDVFECDSVIEDQAYGEIWRVLRPGGYMVLVVPAYEWLMTPEHHKAVHASRRYSKSRLAAVLRKRPVEVIRMTHLFAALFPAVAAYRLGLRLAAVDSDGPPRSELKPMHPALNSLLFAIVKAENQFLRLGDLPFGSSIMAVARKVSS
ncbi:MAG: methyltransferase domain-containing protein [Desulfomonilaceae bacterium]